MKNPRSCSQAELFSMINQVSFAVNDMTLYLDTHPDDDDAMAYFCENTAAPERASERICSPLRSSHTGQRQRKLQTVLGLGHAALALGRSVLKDVEL